MSGELIECRPPRPKKIQEQVDWLYHVLCGLDSVSTRTGRRKKRYPTLDVAVEEAERIATELFIHECKKGYKHVRNRTDTTRR